MKKNAAREIVAGLPDQAAWDDIMYELYVKQKVEAGLRAAGEGRTVSRAEARCRAAARCV